MGYEFIEIEKKEHLTIITINRPEVRNALHVPANKELDNAFNEFADDPDAWVAILTGAGEKSFSAGNDLKWQAQHGTEALIEGMSTLKGGFGGITSRFDCFKPIIAAVNGMALGGGFEIALSCDIIIAAESATFGLPEPKVGLIAAAGGIQRLSQKIPYQLAMGMILTGDTISAEQAFKYGIINEIAPDTEVLSAAKRWADKILACAPLSVRGSKEGAMLGCDLPLKDIMSNAYPGLVAVFQSEDVIEGSIAFAEKRKPQWKGR